MIRHLQKYSDANGPVPGDCWRACIAMVCDVEDLEEVPHFLHLYEDDEDEFRWHSETVRWVNERVPGWDFVRCLAQFPVYPAQDENANLNDRQKYVILSGKSPRGDWGHSVIADWYSGKLIADPHPSGQGLDLNEPLWDVHTFV